MYCSYLLIYNLLIVVYFRFNSSGTILFSVGDDKKIFLIDVSLSNRVEPLLSKLDQRLQTVYKKPLGFEPGFYVLGYLGNRRAKHSNFI